MGRSLRTMGCSSACSLADGGPLQRLTAVGAGPFSGLCFYAWPRSGDQSCGWPRVDYFMQGTMVDYEGEFHHDGSRPTTTLGGATAWGRPRRSSRREDTGNPPV